MADALSLLYPSTELKDVLIYADTVNFTITNTLGTYVRTISAGTIGLNGQQGLPVAIYSVDGGTTWYDGAGPSTIVTSDPCSMQLKCLANGDLQFQFNGGSVPGYGAGASVPVTVKVGMLSQADNDDVPSPIKGARVQAYQSDVNYQTIAKRGEVGVVTGGRQTVNHGLGIVPTFRFWHRYTNSDIELGGSLSNGGVNTGISIDENNLYLDASPSWSGNWIYRIYTT